MSIIVLILFTLSIFCFSKIIADKLFKYPTPSPGLQNHPAGARLRDITEKSKKIMTAIPIVIWLPLGYWSYASSFIQRELARADGIGLTAGLIFWPMLFSTFASMFFNLFVRSGFCADLELLERGTPEHAPELRRISDHVRGKVFKRIYLE